MGERLPYKQRVIRSNRIGATKCATEEVDVDGNWAGSSPASRFGPFGLRGETPSRAGLCSRHRCPVCRSHKFMARSSRGLRRCLVKADTGSSNLPRAASMGKALVGISAEALEAAMG